MRSQNWERFMFLFFSGFGKTALEQRLVDSNSSYLITSDFFQRRGRVINLRAHWEDVLSNTFVKKIIDNPPNDSVFSFKRIYNEAFNKYDSNRKFEAELMDSGDPLFILYTSGTTGKQKVLFRHTVDFLFFPLINHPT